MRKRKLQVKRYYYKARFLDIQRRIVECRRYKPGDRLPDESAVQLEPSSLGLGELPGLSPCVRGVCMCVRACVCVCVRACWSCVRARARLRNGSATPDLLMRFCKFLRFRSSRINLKNLRLLESSNEPFRLREDLRLPSVLHALPANAEKPLWALSLKSLRPPKMNRDCAARTAARAGPRGSWLSIQQGVLVSGCPACSPWQPPSPSPAPLQECLLAEALFGQGYAWRQSFRTRFCPQVRRPPTTPRKCSGSFPQIRLWLLYCRRR